jgi:hypothetical protein
MSNLQSQEGYKPLSDEIPEAKGTPMPVKTPINFRAKKKSFEESNKKAMKKLCTVFFISIIFIAV